MVISTEKKIVYFRRKEQLLDTPLAFRHRLEENAFSDKKKGEIGFLTPFRFLAGCRLSAQSDDLRLCYFPANPVQ